MDIQIRFDEWVAWRQRQPGPTCDHVGCIRKVVWKLPNQGYHFCVGHGGAERLKSLYSEEPIRLDVVITDLEVDLGPRMLIVGGEVLGTADNISIHVAEATEEEVEKLKKAYEIRLVKLIG